MRVRKLIGSRVLVKARDDTDWLGHISGVVTADESLKIDDAVRASVFSVELVSGERVEILGSQISRIYNSDYIREKSDVG
jgi:RNase P/RNase MRP subunit p29